MSEAEFFLTERDELALIERMLVDGAQLVPDLLYREPQAATVETTERFREVYRETRKFFVVYPQLVESPFRLQPVNHREQGLRYFIMQRHGGPVIDLGCGARVDRDGQVYCSASTLGLYPSYWSTRDEQLHKPSGTLLQKYRAWVAFLKQGAVRIVAPRSKRVYWISPDFVSAFSRDLMKLGPPFEDRQEILVAALAH